MLTAKRAKEQNDDKNFQRPRNKEFDLRLEQHYFEDAIILPFSNKVENDSN